MAFWNGEPMEWYDKDDSKLVDPDKGCIRFKKFRQMQKYHKKEHYYKMVNQIAGLTELTHKYTELVTEILRENKDLRKKYTKKYRLCISERDDAFIRNNPKSIHQHDKFRGCCKYHELCKGEDYEFRNFFKESLIKFSLYSLPIFNPLKTIIDSFEILLLPVISIELII